MANNISVTEFSSLIQEYAAYKLSIQGCSQKTVEEYLFDLRTFFRYLIARERDIDFASEEFSKIDVRGVGLAELERLHTEDIYDFLYYTNQNRKNQWSARSRKLSALRSLYKYLVNKRHYLEVNPTADIDSPKPKKTLPKVLTFEESLSLLAAVELPIPRKPFTAIVPLMASTEPTAPHLPDAGRKTIEPERRASRRRKRAATSGSGVFSSRTPRARMMGL